MLYAGKKGDACEENRSIIIIAVTSILGFLAETNLIKKGTYKVGDAMELPLTMSLNLALMIVPPVVLMWMLWQWIPQYIRRTEPIGNYVRRFLYHVN